MDMLDRARARQQKLQEQKSRLEKEFAELKKRLAEVEGELSDIERFFTVAAKLSDEMSPVQRGLPDFPFRGHSRSAEDRGMMLPPKADSRSFVITAQGVIDPEDLRHGEKGRMIRTEAEQIIRTAGPLTARGILEIMDKRGTGSLVTGSDEKSRVSYLSAILSRDDRFESDRSQGGYVLKDTKKNTPNP